ncbi:MAG: glutaredoxin family protein [Pseudohongiellaceae bacterium]
MNNFDLEQELAAAFTEEDTENNSTLKLALYMTPICPYCIYVRQAIAALGLDVEMRNIYERQHFNDLIAARNRATVPVLHISYTDENKEDVWMPESQDIVEYLKTVSG